MTSTSRNLRPSFWVISRTQPTVSALRPLVIALPATNGSHPGVPLKSPIRRHPSAAGASITELTHTLAITFPPFGPLRQQRRYVRPLSLAVWSHEGTFTIHHHHTRRSSESWTIMSHLLCSI